MSKRPARQKEADKEQSDLFAAVTVQSQQKKARRAAHAHPQFALPRSPSAPMPPSKGVPSAGANGLLNVRQAAARLGLSKSTLDKMRCAGKGPRFIKSTDRAVRYDPIDLDAWIADRRRSRTSQD